ncbi:MAG: flippase-like domain-containing protein [Deltaproteobacteria bacterium]|nr:flippase-like domain-containing protein [Deltaproteobacteria bacterium]
MTDPTPKPKSARRGWLLALKVLVTLSLLGWLVRQMVLRDGVDALLERASHLSPVWVVAAVALHFGSASAGVLRWRTLLTARGISQPWSVLFRSFFVGRFLGAFTPSTTGLDGYRLWDIGRRTNDYTTSGAVILVEKLVGLVGMATVCLALLPFGLLERLGMIGVLVAVGMASVALVGLFVLSSPARASAIARLMPGPLRGRATKLAEALAGGISMKTLAIALGLGIVSHACLSATFAASGLAVGIALPPLALLAVGNAIVISVLLPVSIGGVGVREGVAVALLVSAGDGTVTTTDAMLLALVGYLTGQAPALVGGAWLALSRDGARPETPALASPAASSPVASSTGIASSTLASNSAIASA